MQRFAPALAEKPNPRNLFRSRPNVLIEKLPNRLSRSADRTPKGISR